MPCYEAPLAHESRMREFIIAALCHCTARLSAADLNFPGLLKWKIRHDYIDVNGKIPEASYYDTPEFMAEFMEAFPIPLRGE